MRKSGKKKEADAIDEVEELLKLTQDDLLLNLTVNSHTTSKSNILLESSSYSNAIDPDLDRRFQALRSKPKPKLTAGDADDLFARFAALKAPAATPASNSTTEIVKHDVKEADEEEEEEEDEVQKIIDWAVDAARLDPSPPTDSDDDDDDDDDDSDSDSDEVVARKKKGSKRLGRGIRFKSRKIQE